MVQCCMKRLYPTSPADETPPLWKEAVKSAQEKNEQVFIHFCKGQNETYKRVSKDTDKLT